MKIKVTIKSVCLCIVIFMTMPIALTGCSNGVNNTDNTNTNTVLTVYLNDKGSIDYSAVNSVLSKVMQGVKIQLVNYDDTRKLKTEIMAGKGPDVLITDGADFNNYTKLMQTGALADITDFFSSDSEYIESNYYQSVLDCGTYQGRQYIVPLYFSVPTTFLTENEQDKYSLKLTNGQTAFEILNTIEKSDFPIDKLPLFNMGRGFSIPTYLSYEIFSEQTNLTDANMKELKDALISFKPFYENNQIKGVENGLIIKSLYYSGKDQILLMNRHDALEQSIIPLKRNTGGNVSIVEYSVAVSESCKNKQVAYEVVRNLMDETSLTPQHCNSISKISTKQTLIEVLESEGIASDSKKLEISKQRVAEYLDIIEQVDNAIFYDKKYDKFTELFAPYFKGEISLDKALEQASEQIMIIATE